MHHPDHNVSPVNTVPPIIVALVAIIALIELAFQAGHAGFVGGPGAVGWRLDAQLEYGFSGLQFDRMVLVRSFEADVFKRLASYSFIHYGAMHAIFACVMLLAMGKFVGERIATGPFLIVLLLGALSGALAYAIFTDTRVVLVGAYPMVYGLLGAFTCILFVTYEALGENRIKAFQLIGVLLGLRLAFSLIGATPGYDWIAEIAAFVVCFFASFALIPGGRLRVRELLQRLRSR